MNDILHTRQYENLIFEIRGFKLMIDVDLAALYETETKKLKQQVKRNFQRFPPDFMFILSVEEQEQLITGYPRFSNLKHSTINSMVFTEQGVAMLSSVLRSSKAAEISIEIMRAFVYYRQILLQNKDIYKKVADLDEKINYVFEYLLGKIETESSERQPVGYKIKAKNN